MVKRGELYAVVVGEDEPGWEIITLKSKLLILYSERGFNFIEHEFKSSIVLFFQFFYQIREIIFKFNSGNLKYALFFSACLRYVNLL